MLLNYGVEVVGPADDVPVLIDVTGTAVRAGEKQCHYHR